MYVNMDENHRRIYLDSLEAKAVTKEMGKRGCLASILLTLSILLLTFTGTFLMMPGENDVASYAVFGVSVVLFLAALVYTFKVGKKSRASTVTVADQWREKHGDSMLEEIKQQVTSSGTLVFAKNARQKKDFCYLTDKWLVHGWQFTSLDDIAKAFVDTQRVAKYAYVNNLCLVLESTGQAVELPLDYAKKHMEELIEMIRQKNPATLTDKIIKELKKESKQQGEKLKARSHEEIIALYRQRRGEITRNQFTENHS